MHWCSKALSLFLRIRLRLLCDKGVITPGADTFDYARKGAPYLTHKLVAFGTADLLPNELAIGFHALTSE